MEQETWAEVLKDVETWRPGPKVNENDTSRWALRANESIVVRSGMTQPVRVKWPTLKTAEYE